VNGNSNNTNNPLTRINSNKTTSDDDREGTDLPKEKEISALDTDVLDKNIFKQSIAPVSDNPSEQDKLAITLSRMLNLLDETSNSLQEREQMFRHLAETVDSPISVQHDLKILYANSAFADLLGIPQKQLVQRNLMDFIHVDDHASIGQAFLDKATSRVTSRHFNTRLMDRTGRYIPYSGQARVITYRGLRTVISSYSDLSVSRSLKHQIDREKSFSRNVLNSLSVGVLITDQKGMITDFNKQAGNILGRSVEEAIGKHASLIMHLVNEEDHRPVSDPVSQVLQSKEPVTHALATLIQKSGQNNFVPINVTASPLFDERRQLLGSSVLLQESLDPQAISEKLTYEATHDPLTGLINRREFEQRLGQALRESMAGEKEHVLCYLDLNNFKPVNDTAGHRAGDDVLKQVSEKLNDIVRDTDSVGRLGGDEFGVLLYGCPLGKAKEIVQEICETISRHVFRWNEERFSIGVACGLVRVKQDIISIPELLNAADTACYIAKELGGSRYHVFTDEDSRVARDQGSVVWQHRVQDAMTHNRFELHIQRITSLHSLSDSAMLHARTSVMETTAQRPVYEITVRMLDEQGTRYRPELFMPAARRYGLLSSIDHLVVKNTFHAISRGLIVLKENESCSINLSAETFSDSEFLNATVEAFDEYGIDPKNICFEVPEPDVIAHLDDAKRFIRVLNDLGCQFALDDFGRELQSFTYLKQLNIHFLKLDGFYVRTIVDDEVNRAMVAAMIKLAHSLGMKVIAEQVESQAVLDILGELGADFAQGFAIDNTHTLPI
jgi:diguanylate cyclase (GGDEF)-like protein/PAS domain S-box-containing protein